MKYRDRIFRLAIFSLPLAGIFLHLDFFPFPLNGVYSDFSITHYPNAVFLINSLNRYSQIPLWTNSILSGYPFAANPLAGIWYPFGWLAYGFSLPAGLNLVTAFHLIWGAFGMFFFLRQLKLSEFACLAGALLFEALPKIWAHSSAGHLSLVYAISWTPWLLWSEVSPRGRKGWLGGVVLGMILLADIRWAAYAGLLWAGFRLSRLHLVSGKSALQIFTWLMETLRTLLLGVCLSAPLLIPMGEYVSASTRLNLTQADSLAFSLSPGQLLGLFFPDVTGYAEWVIYPGAVGLVAFIWSWFDSGLREKTWFIRWGIIVSILFSLGSNFAPAGWLLSLPGLDFLRVPPRFMLIAGFLFCVITAYWVDHLASLTDRDSKNFYGIRLGLVAFCLALIGLTGIVWGVNGSPSLMMLWGSAISVILTVILLYLMRTSTLTRLIALMILTVALVDTLTFDLTRMVYQSKETVIESGGKVAEFLSGQTGRFRVYSPSYSISQAAAVVEGIELVDGIDPLQLRSYVEFFQKASGIPVKGYSVTVPPFETANPEADNRNYRPNPALLGLLNVKYVVSHYSLEGAGLQLIQQAGKTWIYQNPEAFPRAWVQKSWDQVRASEVTEAEVVFHSPNRVIVNADGPGLLVLSEIHYPGWEVKIDSQGATLHAFLGLFRAVQLPAGSHQVEFDFIPPGIYLGLGIAVVAWAGILIHLFKRWRDDHSG